MLYLYAPKQLFSFVGHLRGKTVCWLVLLLVIGFSRPLAVHAQPLESAALSGSNNWSGPANLSISPPACRSTAISNAHLQVVLDDGSNHIKGTAFTTELTVRVTYTISGAGSGAGTTTLPDKTLKIQQNQPETRAVIPVVLAVGQSISVSASVIASLGSASPATGRLRLVADPEITFPATQVVCYALNSSASPVATDKFDYRLAWTSGCSAATKYQLQILYVPLGVTTPTTSTTLPFDAEGLLIETGPLSPTANTSIFSYQLALAQGAGTYFWRVRAIGNAPGGIATPTNLGAWSDPHGSFVITEVDAPERSRNWIYSRTFTEGGRVAEKLTFANGLQQVRQTQTRLSVAGLNGSPSYRRLLATQVVQDYSGRDAVTSLPIPLTDFSLHYVNKLLGYNATTAYGPAYFDGDNVATAPLPAQQPGEATNSQHYYSGMDNAINPGGRVPDAQGYPFTRTLFTNDGTNRVAEQGGVGETMRIRPPAGTGLNSAPRTVRTYHMGVTPEELYRLFGAESPDPTGVHKILTLDPNNTASVTYQTKEGQTIATALSVISEKDTARLRHLPKSGTTSRVKEHISGSSRTISKTLTLTQQTQDIDIDYSITPTQLGNECVQYCSTCDYTVKIRVIPINSLLGEGSEAAQEFTLPVSNWATCDGAPPTTFKQTISLSAGTYRIEREIIPYGYGSTTQTTTAGSKTLADHLATIGALLELSATAAPWPTINQKLDRYEIEELYAYLDSNNIPKQTTAEGTFYLVPSPFPAVRGFCPASIRLPFLEDYCGTPCRTADFNNFASEAYIALSDTLSALNQRYAGVNVSHQVQDVLAGYDPGILNDLLVQMKAAGYSCVTLRDCFAAELASLETNLYRTTDMPDGYEYNFLRSFLQCTGVHIQEVRIAPDVVSPSEVFSVVRVDPGNAQHLHCIRSLKLSMDASASTSEFDPGSGANLVQAIKNVLDMANLRPPGEKEALFNNLYQCLSPTLPYNPPQQGAAATAAAATAAAADLSQKCFQACEDRRAEFTEAITTRFHLQGIAIEGDSYHYSVAAAGSTVPVLTNVGVTATDPFVESCQIKMLAQELVNHCGSSCDVTAYLNNSSPQVWVVGTNAQQQAIKQVLTHRFDLTVQDLQAGGTSNCGAGMTLVKKIEGNSLETTEITSGAFAIMNSVSALARNVNRLMARPSAMTPLGCGLTNGIGEAIYSRFYHTASVDDASWPTTCQPSPLPAGANYAVAVVDNRTEPLRGHWHDFNYWSDFILDWNTTPYGNCLPRTPNTFGPFTNCGTPLYSVNSSLANLPYYRIRFLDENGVAYDKGSIREISVPSLHYPLPALPPANTLPPYALTSEGVYVQIMLHDTNNQTDRWVTARVDAKGFVETTPGVPDALYSLKWKNITQCTVTDNKRYSMCFAWHKELETTTLPADNKDSVGVFSGPENCRVAAARRIRNAIMASKEAWTQGHLTAFTADYNRKCLARENQVEDFTVGYAQGYYHFTLYYYDRAGNLIRTVPPAGVKPLTAAQVTSMLPIPAPAGSPPGTPPTPAPPRSSWPQTEHLLQTTYTYNSLHQLVAQTTPDAGVTHFYYNAKGQLRFSQNAQQALDGTYSYTRYDELGRVTEVGEIPYGKDAGGNTLTLAGVVSRVQNMAWPTGTGRDVTRTVYSAPATGLLYPTGTAAGYAGLGQHNLLNRVSYSWTDGDGIPGTTADNVYTYYSYDAHGNVEWLCQEMKGLPRKFVRYDYDLVSNKVLRVNYQEAQADQFYHRYGYDADNRLTEVYTSTDNVIWDQDARYQYYDHGPLKRLELGEDHVQGVDYTYTLQGWLKGINHPITDPGHDGLASATGTTPSGQDAFSMTLGYHLGDYTGTSAEWNTTTSQPGNVAPEYGLYNGNIASWTTFTRTALLPAGSVSTAVEPVLGEQYRYDDLNRLVGSHMALLQGQTFVNIPHLQTLYAYDGNGNLLGLRRQGNIELGIIEMDYLTYTYPRDADGRLLSNRLERLNDEAPDDPRYQDIKRYVGTAATFGYNAIGNLVRDDLGKVSAITWNVYGKLATVTTNAGAVTSYRYDAAGNRVRKLVRPANQVVVNPNGSQRAAAGTGTGSKDSGASLLPDPGTGGGTADPQPQETGTAVYYVRDAQGTILAVYEKALTGSTTSTAAPALVEQPIYGSARLGERLTRGLSLAVPTGEVYTREVGLKRYELSDHLGNVRAVVSDEALARTDGPVGLKPDLLACFNYYPFGMEHPGRVAPGNSTLAGGYRFGFNGKEKDNNGELGLTNYDYGFRIYNPAYGRFLSVDPLASSYPFYSSYQYAGNTPIKFIDIDGLEPGEPGNNAFRGGLYLHSSTAGEEEDRVVKSPEYKKGEAMGWGMFAVGAIDVFITKGWLGRAYVGYLVGDAVDGSEQAGKARRTGDVDAFEANSNRSKQAFAELGVTAAIGAALKGAIFVANIANSPIAKKVATEYAKSLIGKNALKELSNTKMPRMISAAVDIETGKVYFGRNGAIQNANELTTQLKADLPSKSTELWSVYNCSECDALNQAYKAGAKKENLVIHTLELSKNAEGKWLYQDRKPCSNCGITTGGMKTTSNHKDAKE